ncbi:uncharacterized protein LOC109831280 [Asparagus officinalis]|uniref:uncharacterized protein LOC109831280 n=1 Tax=Asparagus officinalis TaxID=4686 RepID=UPI00098DEBFB|nr:uncharacterized protein LOC109831280 [Asparagus officinalis]
MELPSCPGFQFNPSDDLLLTFFLPKKIAGGRDALGIPSYAICDFDFLEFKNSSRVSYQISVLFVFVMLHPKLPSQLLYYPTSSMVFCSDDPSLLSYVEMLNLILVTSNICPDAGSRDFRYLNDKKDMHFFSPRHAISSRKGTAKNVKRTAGCGFWNGKGKEQDVFCGSRHVGYKTPLTFVSTEGGKRSNTNWIMHEFHLKLAENSNKFESMVICRIHRKKTKQDREGANSGVADIIEQEEQGTASAATHVEERPLKRKRVEASSSLPPSSSSLLAFLPCKEAEAFDRLISTMDEKRHTVFEQEEEVDGRQVTEMLLKEHEAMTNHFKAAAESGAATSICEQAATYVEDRLRKRKWVEGCSNFCDTEQTSTVNTEAPSQPSSSSPYLSSTWVCAPALDSYEASSSLIDILPPPSQDHWTWEDLEIDVGTASYLDELMECFSDS